MDEVMLDEDENLLVEHDDLITPNFEYGFEEDNDVTAIDAYLGSDYAKQVYSLQIVPEEDDIYTIVEKDGAPKSIAFNGINTWDTWRLIPSSRPVINPPGFKSNYIEIPGMDGSIDISTVLTGGYPTYSNRTGSIEYYVMREYDEYYSWINVYHRIMSYMHGRRFKVILLEDPYYYYTGRMTVNQWRSEKDWSKIVLDYTFDPYKLAVHATNGPWIWDPFDFVNGIVTDYVKYIGKDGKGVKFINSSSVLDFKIYAGSMRICPTFNVSITKTPVTLTFDFYTGSDYTRGTKIKSHDVTLSSSGTSTFKFYDISLKDGTYTLRVSLKNTTINGNDTVSVGVIYRYGSL